MAPRPRNGKAPFRRRQQRPGAAVYLPVAYAGPIPVKPRPEWNRWAFARY